MKSRKFVWKYTHTHTETRDGLEEKQERKHKKSGDQSRGSTMQLMGF